MTTAVILAAGAGTKVWPYAEVRNKCALPVVNVPIVRRLADSLRAVGFQQIAVVVGEKVESIRAAFTDCSSTIRFLEQPRTVWPRSAGTAPAALAAMRELRSDEGWLVVYGDLVIGEESLRAIKTQFEHEKPVAAALIHPLGEEPPQSYLCCEARDGKVSAIEGHSRDFGHRLCGVYALSPPAVRYLENNPGLMRHVPVGGMPPLEAELAESIATMIDDDGEVLAVATQPPSHSATQPLFVDVDKPWHILEANRRMFEYLAAKLDGNQIASSAKIADSAEIEGKLLLGENAVIGERVVINGNLFLADNASVTNGAIIKGSSAIGRESKVRDYAQIGGCVIGNRCIVGHGAEFSGVMFDGAYLYHYCEIYGVVGERVDIGAATVCGTLRFDDQDTPQRTRGHRESPATGANATYFGDFSRTGVNAITMPGVKIGAHSVVGAGVVLYEDLPSRKIVTVKQELQVKDWGPERYGW